MPTSCVGKEGNATIGIHHAESEGWTYTSFPPFVFALNHQTGYAVDIACTPPLHIGCSITTKIGAWGITMKTDDTKSTLIIPRSKVPGKSCLGRMTKGNHGAAFQLPMSTLSCQTHHHFFKGLLAARGDIPILRKPRCHPHQGNVHFLHSLLERWHFIKHLFCHVLLGKHYCLYGLTAFRNPQKGCRGFACLGRYIAS